MDHLDCTYLIKCVDKRKEDLFRFDMQDYMITKKIMWHVFLLYFFCNVTYFFVLFGKKLFYEYQSTTILMPCPENMRLPGPILKKKEQGDFSVSLFWSKKGHIHFEKLFHEGRQNHWKNPFFCLIDFKLCYNLIFEAFHM